MISALLYALNEKKEMFLNQIMVKWSISSLLHLLLYNVLLVELHNSIREALKYVMGWPGPSGFGSRSTGEQVTEGVSVSSNLTAIITGKSHCILFLAHFVCLRNILVLYV